MIEPRTLLNKWELLQAIILDLGACRAKRSATGSTIAVVARLLDHYNNQTGLCCPSNATVAKAVGISERQVTRCTDLLAARGWITKQQRQDNSNLYGFNWGRMVEGNVGDKDTDVTTYRHQCRHLPTPVSD